MWRRPTHWFRRSFGTCIVDAAWPFVSEEKDGEILNVVTLEMKHGWQGDKWVLTTGEATIKGCKVVRDDSKYKNSGQGCQRHGRTAFQIRVPRPTPETLLNQTRNGLTTASKRQLSAARWHDLIGTTPLGGIIGLGRSRFNLVCVVGNGLIRLIPGRAFLSASQSPSRTASHS